jgi:hypothetical protein
LDEEMEVAVVLVWEEEGDEVKVSLGHIFYWAWIV